MRRQRDSWERGLARWRLDEKHFEALVERLRAELRESAYGGLTVAGLVAEGLTNPQIVEHMFISRGTVKAHLSNILRKLDMSTRAEVAAEAARRATEAPARQLAPKRQ
jgi:DNA-binding CsgD family transcriptional regulator